MSIIEAWGWQQYFIAAIQGFGFTVNLIKDGAKYGSGKSTGWGATSDVSITFLVNGVTVFALISGGFFG